LFRAPKALKCAKRVLSARGAENRIEGAVYRTSDHPIRPRLKANLSEMLEIIIIISTIAVITSKNPVHSILFLILVFLNTAILLISHGIDFLGIFIIIVYVGAIAILFLFVLMMLNIKLTEFDGDILRYFPIGFFFGLLFLFALGSPIFLSSSSFVDWFNLLSFYHNNLINLGILLYTSFFPYLFIGTLILLVAMLGVIILTFTSNKKNKYQSVYLQNSSFLDNHLFK